MKAFPGADGTIGAGTFQKAHADYMFACADGEQDRRGHQVLRFSRVRGSHEARGLADAFDTLMSSTVLIDIRSGVVAHKLGHNVFGDAWSHDMFITTTLPTTSRLECGRGRHCFSWQVRRSG